jgi:hypothetical protein
MPTKKGIQALEHCFRDPTVGEGLLKPPATGAACANIRKALNHLGYTVGRGEHYDEQLVKAVHQFQIDYQHTSDDGFVGPGTRQLLAQTMAQKLEPYILERALRHMEDPEEQLKRKLQAPLIKDIERKTELIETYKEHLHILELQVAKFGTLMAPPHLQTGIQETKEIIDNLKREIVEIKKKIEG